MYNYAIIVVHKGNPDYLHTCLKQAHFSNPNSRIILLGDESNKNCLPFVEWYDINDFTNQAKKFESIYRHMSVNAEEYERFALSKWFSINEFMIAQKLEKVFINDSDVLIYTDFSQDKEHYNEIKDYDLTVSNPYGQETMFFHSQKALQGFCDYIISVYEDEKIMSDLAQIYASVDFCRIYKNQPKVENKGLMYKEQDFELAPVSDMTMIRWYTADTKSLKYFDYANNDVDNKLVLTSMQEPEYVKMGDIINIIFVDKKPFAYNKNMGRFVQLHTLHFQGSRKQLMPKYATFDKDDQWEQPAFDCRDIAYIFGLKIPEQKPKFNLRNSIIKLFCCLIPIKKLRRKIRGRLI